LKKTLHIKAPGRICLFGDHQDYLGLPVIACAIDREVLLSSEANGTKHFYIKMPDIARERIIPITETFDRLAAGDHLASTLRVVRRYGCIPNKGFDIELNSTIPINAGISSSSAIVVAWTHFLLKAFGCDREITPALIAQLAYEAEVVEHNSPGGKMDQFTISLGEIIYIDTSDNFSFKTIGNRLDGLILGESGVPKETIGLLAEVRGKAQQAIGQAQKHHSFISIENVTMEEVANLSECISEALRPYFYAAVKNHSITQQALLEFEKDQPNNKVIGRLMNAHHEVLKNTLQITVPLIDTMIDAALKSGAYGAKIVGSGGGGCVVALSPPDKIEEVISAIEASGAKAVYEVKVAGGTALRHEK
jgi:galactokinase